MKIKLAFVFLLTALLAGAYSQQTAHKDILYTLKGEEFFGELQKVTEDSIYFLSRKGELLTFSVNSVKSIDLGKKRPGDDWENMDAIDDPLLKRMIDESPSSIDIAKDYAEAGYLILYEKVTYKLFEDGSSEWINRQIIKVVMERGKDEANQIFSYNGDNQSLTIDFARSVNRSGQVISINDNAVEDASVFSYLPEYQRMRRKKFALKDVTLGSIIDFQVTRKTIKHDAFNPFYTTWNFQQTEPVLYSAIEVIVPKGEEIDYHSYNLETKPEKNNKDGYTHYLWEMKDIDPYIAEQSMAPPFLVTPSIIIALSSSWQDVGKAYYERVMEAFSYNKETTAKVNNLLADNPPNKLEVLYNFVAENIENKGLGFHSYYPYPKNLDDILKNGFGSQQDITFLLWGMLRIAGIESDLCLFPYKGGYQVRLAKDIEALSPFDIVGIKVKGANSIGYLSPNEFIRYDQDYNILAGVTCLLIKQEGSELVDIPELVPEENMEKNEIKATLNVDGSVQIEHEKVLYGTAEEKYRKLKYQTQKELDNYFEDMVKGIDNKASLVEYDLAGYKSLEDRVSLTIEYSIPNFAITAGEQILALNFPTINYSAYGFGAPSRYFPMHYDYTYATVNEIEILLPGGYDIYHIAEDIEYGDKDVKFKAEVSEKDRKVFYRDEYSRDVTWIETEEYQKFKELIENRAKISREWVVLKKVD
ncbi:DUF3857 domain-containing protein [bacterium]|nr:DUF3857 domain-containing protein [bacterium]